MASSGVSAELLDHWGVHACGFFGTVLAAYDPEHDSEHIFWDCPRCGDTGIEERTP